MSNLDHFLEMTCDPLLYPILPIIKRASDYIVKHPIIVSLSHKKDGDNRLSVEQLIEIKNDFYTQDYFYLACGYENVRNALIANSRLGSPLEKIGSLRDPFSSRSVETLITEIRGITGVNLSKLKMTDVTYRYVEFLISTFSYGKLEAMISRFICTYTYAKIAEKFSEVVSEDWNNHDQLEMLIKFFSTEENRDACNKNWKIINKLIIGTTKDNSKINRLVNIVEITCKFEMTFLNQFSPL